MDNAFRYWQLVRLTGSGQCQFQVLAQVQTWVQATFASLLAAPDTPEHELQRSLLTLWRSPADLAAPARSPDRDLAQLSLRCYVTHHIHQACVGLAARFGETYGFKAAELLAQVLDDDGQIAPAHRFFTLEILQTYDVNKGALSTWSSRLTQNHTELNQLLLEKGLYRASDWAILNDTSLEQVQRILRQYHLCSEYEVTQAVVLLERYHRVYRRDRMAQRQTGKTGRCQVPTPEQLRDINPDISAREVLIQLNQLADRLRQHRIVMRGGSGPIYQPEDHEWDRIAGGHSPLEVDDQEEFLQAYREALEAGLDEAIAQAIQANIDRLQSRQPPQDRAYVRGLHLFYCQGQAMGQLAAEIGLSTQVQVSRFLNRKQLQADVRHRLLPQLYETVRQQALSYVSADRLRAIDHTLEALLSEEVDQMMAEAEAEAKIPKNRTARSLFARHLCTAIDQFMPGTE
ncbi:hypothetical protein [Nodosilinea nodulosa]|uniref:hypothetical protein n=1 Tax=Nodosilinea nodulosa TaxID=416001 RepID=UPI000312DF54|nr:hypothetical protein [Nodosilinea nodulosa]